MKIWKEFGSSHSGNVSVIGTFLNQEDAQAAMEMIEDFTLGEWEERHASVKEFLEVWSEKFHPDVKYTSIYQTDYSLGIDNAPTIELIKNRIEISKLRTSNVGGLIKLMLFAGAKTTNVTNNNQ